MARAEANKIGQPTMAEQADLHELYEEAVQNVEGEIEFLQDTFRDLKGRDAVSFREDFCGTASASCEWVRSGAGHHAIGVDIDRKVLEWGRKNRIGRLPEVDRPRVKLLNEDVMRVETGPVDIIAALNFSYWIFKTRDAMRDYFSRVRDSLHEDGVLFLDAYGGSEAFETQKEKTKCDGFTYVWHQAKYEPVTGRTVCHIDFRFPDGSKIKRAFSYDWRLWTIPELREILLEAGFSQAEAWWDATDGEDEDDYQVATSAETYEAWIAYVVGQR